MDHVVYLDAKADEMSKILDGTKTMIIRGAAGRKLPYGKVSQGDVLYFINNNAEGLVKCKAIVEKVFNSEKMSPEESSTLVSQHQSELQLTEAQFKKWAGKRYIVLIGLNEVEKVEPFVIDKSSYGNMDDWLPVGEIKKVKQYETGI